MLRSVVNSQHYLAHQIVMEFHDIMAMASSAEQLDKIEHWKTKASHYATRHKWLISLEKEKAG